MPLRLVIVDSFTNKPFSGNPAAVAVVGTFPSDLDMQLVAREMNLSETAFLAQRVDGDFDLRWFTPSVEVDLCGHATLAAAHSVGSARFHTKSGILTCEVSDDGWITMDFPADPPVQVPIPEWLDVPGVISFNKGRAGTLMELDQEANVRSFQPDPVVLMRVDAQLNIITARGDQEGIDFVSRVFCPGLGIPEDPVTGSAHCMLAEYWGERLGRTTLVGEQASTRGGMVKMERTTNRVKLIGQAVTVGQVELQVSDINV